MAQQSSTAAVPISIPIIKVHFILLPVDMSTAATSGDDTYTDPQDAIKHIDALFAIFSDAASGGVEEQRKHFKRFVALNDK